MRSDEIVYKHIGENRIEAPLAYCYMSTLAQNPTCPNMEGNVTGAESAGLILEGLGKRRVTVA
jgi:hypothetical protein